MASSNEINGALRAHEATRPYYIGCFSADAIPTTLNYPCALVVNTDPSSLPGSHWVAFYAESDEQLEMFDSFGHSYTKYPQFSYFIDKFETVKFNGMRLQQYFSSTCGYYALVFILFRCKKFSMEDVVHLFTDNHGNNDQVVTSFVNRTWRFNKSIYSSTERYQMSKMFLPN